MVTLVNVLVVLLIGFLGNRLSERYDFPGPKWLLWVPLIGFSLLYELKDDIPKALTQYFRQADPAALAKWTFWGGLGLITVATLALVVFWPRPQVESTPTARDSTGGPVATQGKAAVALRGRLLKAMQQYVATRRRESLHNSQRQEASGKVVS